MPPGRSDSRIGEQNTAYRRGLVLGLTMAEVGILVIFVLLLLLALGAFERERYAKVMSVPPDRLETLVAAEEALRSLQDAIGAEPADTPEEIQELVRALAESAHSPEGQTSLKAMRSALAEIKRAEAEIRRTAERLEGESGSMAETVAQQSRDLAIKEGQLQYAEQRLRALGSGGSGARPCWVEPNGSVVFLYDVILASAGIRMKLRDGVLGSPRLADLPVAVIDPLRVMSEDEFRSRTRALYDYGRRDENRCRFHVYVWDGTASAEKERYKDLLRTVEGHFYKQTMVPSGIPF